MSKNWLCLVLFNLFLKIYGESTHNNEITPPFNTGNCSFIDNVYFKQSCVRTINKRFDRIWNNDRAPAGTEYATWINQYYPDVAIFTFHRSNLFNCEKLKVHAHDYSIEAKGQSSADAGECDFNPTDGDLHCLDIRIKYPAALIAECQRTRYKDVGRVQFPVFYFSTSSELTSRACVKSVMKAIIIISFFGLMRL